MKLSFHSAARAELRSTKAFYRSRSPLAAIAFAQEIQSALLRIAESPLRYPPGESGTRVCVLPWRFPYTIVYYTVRDMVVIVAIAHQSREPGYWQDRLSE